jgi:hypothetical protein
VIGTRFGSKTDSPWPWEQSWEPEFFFEGWTASLAESVDAARDAGFMGAVTKSRSSEIVEAVEALVSNQLFFGS